MEKGRGATGEGQRARGERKTGCAWTRALSLGLPLAPDPSPLFVFLSLFLGSAMDFYYHFWWWDLVLHTASGFLLGIIACYYAFGTVNLTELAGKVSGGAVVATSIPLLLF